MCCSHRIYHHRLQSNRPRCINNLQFVPISIRLKAVAHFPDNLLSFLGLTTVARTGQNRKYNRIVSYGFQALRCSKTPQSGAIVPQSSEANRNPLWTCVPSTAGQRIRSTLDTFSNFRLSSVLKRKFLNVCRNKPKYFMTSLLFSRTRLLTRISNCFALSST